MRVAWLMRQALRGDKCCGSSALGSAQSCRICPCECLYRDSRTPECELSRRPKRGNHRDETDRQHLGAEGARRLQKAQDNRGVYALRGRLGHRVGVRRGWRYRERGVLAPATGYLVLRVASIYRPTVVSGGMPPLFLLADPLNGFGLGALRVLELVLLQALNGDGL